MRWETDVPPWRFSITRDEFAVGVGWLVVIASVVVVVVMAVI